MRGGKFLAEETPHFLLQKYHCESLEDVFLKLSVLQNMGKRRRSSIIQEVSEQVAVPAISVSDTTSLVCRPCHKWRIFVWNPESCHRYKWWRSWRDIWWIRWQYINVNSGQRCNNVVWSTSSTIATGGRTTSNVNRLSEHLRTESLEGIDLEKLFVDVAECWVWKLKFKDRSL